MGRITKKRGMFKKKELFELAQKIFKLNFAKKTTNSDIVQSMKNKKRKHG